MLIENEKAWIEFLETPIAELEGYGLDIRFIGELEDVYGLYIKDLRTATAGDICSVTRNFGVVAVKQLSRSLSLCWKEIESDRFRDGA